MLDLRPELDLALRLADECGAIALRYQQGGDEALQTEEKAHGGGPVTRADKEVDRRIVDALLEAFPGDTILAEESHAEARLPPDLRGRREGRCWLIDPVDGTRDFARGEPHWAIHIGLAVEGRPLLGVVAEPAKGRLTWGLVEGEGAGAWCRDATGDRTIRVASAVGDALRLVSSKSHSSPRTDEIATALGVPPERHQRLGSTGVKITRVARGEADVYAHPTAGTKLWDSGAPQAILEAAGGRLTDLTGEPLRYLDEDIGNRRGLLATSTALHPEVAARMSTLAADWF